MRNTSLMSLELEDFTGQVRRRVSGISADAAVSELQESLTCSLNLPQQDPSGRPVIYNLVTGDGVALNPSDIVGDVLKENERVILSPSVTAG